MAPYDQRIATRITRSANAQLRLAARVRRQPLSALLTDLISKGLPTADELATLLRDDADTELAS